MMARPLPLLVLVADADPYICRVFEAKLTKDNQYRVVSGHTAQEALQFAIQNEPDGILWDVRLRDSERLLPRLRAIAPHATLILMTTDDVPPSSDIIACLDVVEVLTKPFGLDTLVDTLRLQLDTTRVQPACAHIGICRVGHQMTLSTSEGVCVTRVLESGLDTFVVIGAPRVQTPSDFAPGKKVHVQSQGYDALYTFNTSLIRFMEQPLPTWELRMPRTIQRRQRRRYPRLPLHVEIVVTATEETQIKETRIEPIQATTENIGGGGCAFVYDESLPAGTPVLYHLSGGQQEVTGTAVVLRTEFSMNGNSPHVRPQYRVALQFDALPVVERRRLHTLLKA